MNEVLLTAIAAREALAWLKRLALVFGISPDDPFLDTLAHEAAAAEFGAAVTVARMVVLAKVESLLKAVESAVTTGVIPENWQRDDLPQSLIATGLTKDDPRLMFQATLRSSYGAGSWDRAKRSGMPLLTYRTMGDDRVREAHAILDGVTLPIDDPFWVGPNSHYPPNDWNCRCVAKANDEEGVKFLEDHGVQIQREAPKEEMVTYVNKLTGEKTELPASLSPSWNFNPAENPARLAQTLERRLRAVKDGMPL